MENRWRKESGFALITALLMILLVSAIAVSMVYVTTSESKIGGSDLEVNEAQYAAEAALEKMTSELDSLYSSQLSPSASSITALASLTPSSSDIPNISYNDSITFPAVAGCATPPCGVPVTLQSGPDAGLQAELVQLQLNVIASRPEGTQVKLNRNVEVALIPVFQFGVFSEGDLSFFAGPNYDFAGRIHTNGNAYLEDAATLTLHAQVSAYGDIYRDYLPNGLSAALSAHTGTVMVPTATSGCDGAAPHCRALSLSSSPPEGSWTGGLKSAGRGSQNPNWTNISLTTYNKMIINGQTGATNMQLPFVQPGVTPVQIIRQPLAGESASSAAGQSRLYNQATVRVFLADTQAELPYDQSNYASATADPNNVPITNTGVSAGGIAVTGANPTFFAEGTASYNTSTHVWSGPDTDWKNMSAGAAVVPAPPTSFTPPDAYAPVVSGNTTTYSWPLITGWLRVDVRTLNASGNPLVDASGNPVFTGVTNEWLGLGFARAVTPPTAPATNPVHTNAIVLLQEYADYSNNGTASNLTIKNSKNNWYPINFYDAREGELRDYVPGGQSASSCGVNGIMNAVEVDVGNLSAWLAGTTGTFNKAGSGNTLDSVSQNGYVLYFSDRRHAIADPNVTPAAKNGESGLEDIINPSNGATNGQPNQTLDTGEDVDGNGKLDMWGATNMGVGFGFAADATGDAVWKDRIDCVHYGRKYHPTGPRQVLRLVDGALGNLPSTAAGGGFTVGSENPVYVLGSYNATTAGYGATSVPASIVADAVTLLSDNWNDLVDDQHATNSGSRPASANSYYRMAIAAGKNMNYPNIAGTENDNGTDGGMHNFLRLLENWGASTLNYQGSMVSLYFSQYATGAFKDGVVYSAPTRNFAFDTNFLTISKLPPATPRFKDVNNTGASQDYTPQ